MVEQNIFFKNGKLTHSWNKNDDDDDDDDDIDDGFVAPPSLGQLSHIGKVSSSVVSFPSFFIAFQTEEISHGSFPVNPIWCGSGWKKKFLLQFKKPQIHETTLIFFSNFILWQNFPSYCETMIGSG